MSDAAAATVTPRYVTVLNGIAKFSEMVPMFIRWLIAFIGSLKMSDMVEKGIKAATAKPKEQ